jgi:carbon-monoxide dehydrogenase iron sulfur subunit
MLIYNSEKCTGCEICSLSCSMRYYEVFNIAKSRIKIYAGKDEDGVKLFSANVCNQCGVCVDICPVEALSKDENGVIILDSEECIGCNACVEACPTGSMFIHPDIETPFKCIDCGECVEMCPQDALSLGEMLEGSEKNAV